MACIFTALIFTSIFLLSALLTHTVVIVEAQLFQVFPSNTCVPCGGSTKFNCTTTAVHPLRGGGLVKGVGGQLWRIQYPNGTVITLSSSMPDNLPAGYEFISSSPDEYTGLHLLDANPNWNGTTFQCIAFTPANEEEQNNSATAVTLEVGGLPHKFSCRCQCPDVHRSGNSDQCTIMWKRPPTVSCSSVQFNVLLMLPDGTPFYSDGFGQGTSTTRTVPLNPNTVYRVAITAENVCGDTTCFTNCSTVPIDVVDCGTLTNPANSQVSYNGGTTFGQTATYSCNAGYNLVGNSTRTCEGVWSGSEPTCQAASSPTPTQLPSETPTPSVSAGAIAGGGIGGLVGMVLIILIIVLLIWKTKNSPRSLYTGNELEK